MERTLNLRDLVLVVADQTPFMRRMLGGMLRGFGANRVLEAANSAELQKVLAAQKIDLLVCDLQLRPDSGLKIIRALRKDAAAENRIIPILVMCSEANSRNVATCRDAGANMVIAKPISAKSLYDRLSWIASSKRQFVETKTYFGPDRRFKIEGYPNGVGRRAGDQETLVSEEAGPGLEQGDIDSLFNTARLGNTT